MRIVENQSQTEAWKLFGPAQAPEGSPTSSELLESQGQGRHQTFKPWVFLPFLLYQ